MTTTLFRQAAAFINEWKPNLPHAARWPLVIERAQSVTHAGVPGEEPIPRVPWGEEEHRGAADGACGDCGCAPGQAHVPGCSVEECPSCARQMIACSLRYGCAWGKRARYMLPELAGG